MADMARATGRNEAAAEYEKLYEKIKQAFAKKYLREDGALAVDTQTAYALAFDADLIPENLRKVCAARLDQKLRDNGCRMATGFLGTRPLLPALSSVGENNLAVRLLQSHKFPSWGYEIEQGATTIWERWNSYTKEHGFEDAGMNSFAHYAYGAVCEWMFSRLAGIETDGAGFQKIIIHPSPPTPGSNPDREPISWVKARYDSIRGPITISWKREKITFRSDGQHSCQHDGQGHPTDDRRRRHHRKRPPIGASP